MGCGGSSGNSILEPKGRKIMLMGTSSSGKTSIFYQLTKGISVPAIPTVGHNAEYLAVSKDKFVVYDIGGRNQDFAHLLVSAVALVFLVDAANSQAVVLKESVDLFNRILKEPAMQGLPIAICLNKQDLKDQLCIDENTISTQFQLAGKNAKIFKVSYKERTGLLEPFEWLASLKLKPSIVKKSVSSAPSAAYQENQPQEAPVSNKAMHDKYDDQ